MNSALAVIGNGLGNLIEQSVLPTYLTTLYDAVDIWTPRSSAVVASVLRDMPGIRRLYTEKERPAGKYKAAYASWLVAASLADVQAEIKLRTRSPNAANELSEAAFIMRQLFGSTVVPSAYCAHTDAKVLPAEQPAVGLVCGSQPGSWRFKRYPHFADVVAHVHAKLPDVRFHLFGIPTDDPVNHSAVDDWRGKLELLDVCAALRQCQLVLATDTGLAHAAAAMQVTTLVLFGPTQVEKNLPPGAYAFNLRLPCQPCQYRSPRLGLYPHNQKTCAKECLRQLDPADVAGVVITILQNKLAQGG